ncbi:MAG: VCBS repeat-containing protein [Verrucomicrobia bacterium]|nr:VCBS repeat-containing protein [Verrucomicrobiota bacterium]
MRGFSSLSGALLCFAAHLFSPQSLQAAGCAPAPPGLVGWWAGQSNTLDTAGLHGGALVNGATYAAGKIGAAFRLDGTDDYVELGAWSPGPAWTCEAWVNASATNSGRRTILGGTAGGTDWAIVINNGQFGVNYRAPGGGVAIAGSGVYAVTGAWYHVAATCDGATARIYVNGVLRNSGSTDPNYGPYSGSTRIGGEACCNGANFAGLVDEAAVFSRALTDAEILAIYNADTAGKCLLPSGAVPYFASFETNVGAEWLDAALAAEGLFSRFSGRFGNQAQRLVLTNLVVGQSYTLGFDFYALDSWDGSAGDFFNVAVNSVQVFHETFSNYNGDPPSNPQSFARSPDEGRTQYGYRPDYVDAIYRNVELSFTASNAYTTFTFSGQNLEDLGNESWGLDNVSVRLTSDVANTVVRSTSLPVAGVPSAAAIESFTISASRPLQTPSSTNGANYVLREAGANGALGDGDDRLLALTPSLPGAGGRSVLFSLGTAPLQPGLYRFQTAGGLLDTNSASVPVFTRDFTVMHPVFGAIENTNNDTTATILTNTLEALTGHGFYSAFGVGTIASTSDVDYWRFNAEAGDVLTVRIECEAWGVYPQLHLQNASSQNVGTWSGDYGGVVGFQNLTIGTPGTYYLRVFSNNNRSRYGLRLDQSRGPQMESEGNDSTGSANQITLTYTTGQAAGRIAGALPAADTGGDFFRLGMLNVGNEILAAALYPTGSTLTAGQTIMSVFLEGNPVALATNTTGTLDYNVVSNGVHFLRVTTPSRDLRAQYLLNVTSFDGVPPTVTGVTFPAESGTTTALVDGFTLTFSEDMSSASVSNLANYELRGAGPDDTFGTGDDALYTIVLNGYTGGLTASYTIPDGPVQPGRCRFTARATLLDRANNPMAAAFVRTFFVASIPGYVIENRNNDAGGLATPLSLSLSTNGDGTFGWAGNIGAGSRPQFVAAALLNGDTNLDLVAASVNSGTVTVMTNNGQGVFTLSTNVPTGSGAVCVTFGDFNGDGRQDAAVANYYAGTVSVLQGDGNGGFVVVSNYSGFCNPYNLAAADLNGDTKTDLAVPSYCGGTLRVLLGNGDGTFQVSSNYSTGSNPEAVSVGDVNGDTKKDLVVVNYGSGTATLLLGNGTGTFQIATNLSAGPNPRYVVLADVTGDSTLDIVIANPGDNSVSILAGNGNGTFQPRRYYWNGTGDCHQLSVADFNGDGSQDIVVPGYGNNTFGLLLNNGSGVFTNLYQYGHGGNPIGSAVGDFNGDGRPDIAFCQYYGDVVSVWFGMPAGPLAEDPPGSGLRTGYGRGARSSSGDVDFYQFSGLAGDLVVVAVDVPGNPAGSGLNYRILRADGSVLTEFNADYYGWGQSGTVTLPQSGTYLVRVAGNWDYQGEYRIRVTVARPPVQFESEDNNSQGNADPVTMVLTNGQLTAKVLGYLSVGDGNGDYFQLGTLLGGATVTLGFTEPSASRLSEVISLYNVAGVLMTNSLAGATNLVFVVPAGQGEPYYARLTPASGGFTPNAETAVRFYGGSDYAHLGNWFNYQSFTLSMWLNPASSQNWNADILDNNHRGGINWVIQQQEYNHNQYGWWPQDGGAGVPFALTPNTWQHLAITRDSTNISRVYLNGVLIGSNAAPSQINYDGNQFLSIARWGGGGRNWNGTFDDLRIWNRPLSQAEIIAGLSGALTGSEPNLVGYWRFNEGVGTNAADLSPSNHPAALVNGPSWAFLAGTNALAPGIHSQYILSVALSNAATPAVTSVSLPADGATSSNIFTAFGVTFSEDMDPVFSRLWRNIYRNGGHSYLLTDSAMSWQSAEAAAVTLGGHLATINNQAENTWVNQTFTGSGELWLGLNDLALKGSYVWSSGEPFTYNNWAGGQPNNGSGYEDCARMYADGRWDDTAPWSSLRGVIEVASATDADGDGLVDAVDPYPADALNAFDLRAAGADSMFDTPDDQVYRIYAGGYSSGTNASFVIQDGPLQPGNYRFKVTTALRDRFGNAMAAPYLRYFTIAGVPGLIVENRRGVSGTSTTSLSLTPSNQMDGSFSWGPGFGTGSNPHYLTQGLLNGDTNLDLVTANLSGDNISIHLGDATGSFQLATNVPTGNGAISAFVADFNADNKRDLAVANYYSGTVSILLGDGNGGVTVFTNHSGFANPCNLVAGDFNHDNKLDLAVPNYGNGTVRVLFGNGDGSFQVSSNYTVAASPETVVAAPLNADPELDLVVANYDGSSVSVLLGNADGTFLSASNYPAPGRTRYATVGDVNKDGKLDIVGVSGATLFVLPGNGDGTFGTRADYSTGGADPYQVVLADIDSDGWLDGLVASYGNNRFITILNNGDGTFGPLVHYYYGGRPISLVTGDYNRDGLLDAVFSSYEWNNFIVMLGNNTEGLPPDPGGTGLRLSGGRGSLADSSDLDYWTFTTETGDRLSIAVETVGSPSGSGLAFNIYYPDGGLWTTFYSDYNGRGQIALTIPVSGTYQIRVANNWTYSGEYRLRVTTVPPPVQVETEANDNTSQANTLTFALAGGRQTGTVLGYVGNADGSGDFYRLGNLSAGTIIKLGLRRPASSGLLGDLVVYNSSGAVVAISAAGATNFTFTVPAGGEGAYYAQVWDAGPAAALPLGGTDGYALRFNGGNDWIAITNAVIPASGDFTVEAWAYSYGSDGYHDILSQGSGGNAFYMGYRSWKARAGDGWEYIDSVTYPQGGWHHIAVVKSSTNTLFFIDGTQVAARGSAIPNPVAADGLRIGRQYGPHGEWWGGLIDEIRVWNTARTAAELQVNLSNRLTGAESSLVGYWRFDEGTSNVVLDATANASLGTFQNYPVWVPSTATYAKPSSIFSQYLLDIELGDAQPPYIVAVSLPADGTTNSSLWDRFSITFSEDMTANTVTNAANYELRGAGSDNAFGTADDQLYAVQNSPEYGSGLSASYFIGGAPLQAGQYRFTISTGLADRAGSTLTNAYVRNFIIADVPGYLTESRTNNTQVAGTTLSLARTNRADGSFAYALGPFMNTQTERIAVGRIDGDTNLDLVTANWHADGMSVLLGRGDGTFQVKTNIGTGNSAWAIALGQFTADTNLDCAVANYDANTVTILRGGGDGSFQVLTNITVGSRPYHVVTADFNADAKTDLAVPNYSGSTVSILLGNGDGSFRVTTNYATGSSPMYAAVGDANRDGKLDLVIANYDSDNVTVHLGNGNGTFAAPVGVATGHRPRAVALADLDRDGKLDLAVLNGGDNTFNVMFGNGDGSFQPRAIYPANTSDGYEILAIDLNGDTWPDLVVGGYHNHLVSVVLNRGDGTFLSPTTYGLGYYVVGLAAGDFNNDGRTDLACGNDSGTGVYSLIANDTEPLASDSADGSLRTGAGRGNLTSGSDPDYWSFYAEAGDRLSLACQNPVDSAATGLRFVIYLPSGASYTDFYADYYGRGQLSTTLPVTGTYYIGVSQNWGYTGEYRFRVTLARPPMQLESEDNNNTSQADPLTFVSNAGHQQATVLGYESSADGSDFYQLGNLSAGTTIQLGLTRPNSSHLLADLVIYNSAGAVVAISVAGATNLTYTVPVGGDGAHYAQVWDAGPAVALPLGGTDGYALRFNGGNDWIAITNAVIPASGDFTVEAWAYSYGSDSYHNILSQGTGGNAFYMGYRSWKARAGDGWEYIDSVMYPQNGWHHIAVVKSSTNTLFFIDGTQVAARGSAIPNPVAADGLRIGRQYGPYGEYWGGLIDEVRVWNKARTAAELQLNLSNRLTGAESGLVGYWSFDEGAGATIADASPAGHLGRFQNFPVWVPSSSEVFQPSGIFSQYVLSLDISDSVGPAVASVTLPAAGSTNFGVIDRFTVGFNKDIDASINAVNRYLRSYGGHAYTITDAGMTWYNAETAARAVGGHLVTLNTSLENDWVRDNFYSVYGNVWIGMSDEAQRGTYVWASGESVTYTNWDAGQPNNNNNADYGVMRGAGLWAMYAASANYRGVIEVAGPDTDGDGLPDTLDPFPNDAMNLVDLRAAGLDSAFDTADDSIYRLSSDNYTGGLSLNYYVTDGPLQPGNYRFTVTSSLRDRFGNPMNAPMVRYFTVGGVPGYVFEGRTNNSSATATALPLVEDPPGVKSAAGRGKLYNGSDEDWWSFTGAAGELLTLAVEVPGYPNGGRLRYEVFHPNGSRIIDLYPEYYGSYGQQGPVTLSSNGTYTVRITQYDGYYGEYRFRITTVTTPVQMESEDNANIANADPLTFTVATNSQAASVAGFIRLGTDLDYFNLGVVSNGYSIFLNVRLPLGSALAPVVSVYNAANAYQGEAPGGRPDDGVAEVRVTSQNTYYAVVRSSAGVGGIDQGYLLDVQVLPTGTLSFPNLQVVTVTPPTAGSIQSGQQIAYSFSVQNVGSLATAGASWIDRASLSQDTVLGNADDIPLGFITHSGALAPGAGYSVTNTFTLPEGVSGDYYLIVMADAGNAVNEFLFESDNTTVSASTFHINLAPYPDLRVENLVAVGPDAGSVFTISWNTVNRGNLGAPAGFRERHVVRNITSGAILANVEQTAASALAPAAVWPHQISVVASNSGVYQVQVTTDSQDNLWEFDGLSHAGGEANNAAATNFSILSYFNVTVQSSPPGAGTLTGAGSYSSGTTVTVTATPVTTTLPYYFVNWTEGGAFQSASTNYSFIISRDRTLLANFSLPSFQLSASNNPPAGGTVAGQGTYFYGTTNVLTANANFGYRFTNWTEGGSVLSTAPSFSVVVTSNRSVVANYVEANTTHVVSLATQPSNVVALAGAGIYTNGQSTNFTAPLSVTNPPSIFNFKEWRLNGAFAGSSASFSKGFTTLDPTNMQFVAVYDTVSILPLVTNVTQNLANPVPATTNFVLSFQFNRSMNTNFTPVVALTNLAAPVQAVVPPGGSWNAVAVSNDTFTLRPITFATGMDGTNRVWISQARDFSGGQLALTNVRTVVVDVTPPANPVLTLTASNNSSATVSWSAYTAPADLNSFRLYLATNSFTSVAGLVPVSTLGAGSRSFTYYSLSLDRPYFAVVAAVDNAGNSASTVTPLSFILPSSVPPPVPLTVTAPSASSALVSWTGYDTTFLLGFAAFRLYYETNNFTSVASLTAKQVLGTGVRSAQIDGLDRTRTYYFAVVGYNGNNAFNPNVTATPWSDPYAGNIAANTTIGGAGQPVVDILQSITVVNSAVLTIPAGTTLRFAPGTKLTVQQGRLNAVGTALDPVVFTSANDQSGLTPAAGDWNGVFLGSSAGPSVLRHVFVKYGAGLTISNCSPTVDAFTALYNVPAGLTHQNGGAVNTTNALLAFNGVGAQQLGASQLLLNNSVIKNNDTNALGFGGPILNAAGNWWGSAVPAEIDALLQGAVDRTGFLTGEPLLTPAIGTSNNVTQIGNRFANLRLACRTADSMRLSEDSTFFAVFFAPFANSTTFQVGEGGGAKTLFAQFRSITGQTSAPVSVTVTYITAGPSIAAFNLSEGQQLTRPLTVTGSASAPLGMAAMEFYVDNVGQGTNAGGSFSQWFDPRGFSSAVHRVKLVARDTSGNFSTLERNVVVAPTPPPAPVIAVPATDVVVNTNTVFVSGTAEPFIEVRLMRAGTLLRSTNASAAGAFSFANVPLIEGANLLAALAVDALGAANSAIRNVTLDTIPPAQLVMEAPVYRAGVGLSLSWKFPTTGKRASTFRVFWHTAPFTATNQATGQSVLLASMDTTLQGLATSNYWFTVVGYDSIGNASPLSTLVQFYYDAVPPSFNVAFDKASPVGVGPLRVTLISSKALNGMPTLTVRPSGSSPAWLSLTNTALNTYEGVINVTTLLPSGPVVLNVSAQDTFANPFNGPPSGPALSFDVNPPDGVITTAPLPPVQATNNTSVAVNLQLTEAPKPGTTPTINFGPPVGSPVAVTMTGSGVNWNGTLTLTPAMGSGIGHFTMTVVDSLDNVGHNITAGSSLEIYNTALPSPPGQPVGFQAGSLGGGRVQLNWFAVSNAEIYRVYSEPGTNFTAPTLLVADNVASNSYIDLPPADGYYRYVVTALRRGSEGTNSITRVALSDRTPPPAPTNVAVQLVASGLQITWQAGAGQTPASFNVYRNGALIRTVSSVAPVIDNPPRGTMNYTVGALDVLGNEALSQPATVQLLVGAVNHLQALVNIGQAPMLSWISDDPTAVGFNVYRNGIKQNSTPQAGTNFTDTLPLGSDTATYAVRAVNSTNAESAARSVVIYPAELTLFVNSLGGDSNNPPTLRYFDDYRVTVSNLVASGALPLRQIELRRTGLGLEPMTVVSTVGSSIGVGNWLSRNLAVPCASNNVAQAVRLRAVQETDVGGSSVIYQRTFDFPTIQTPGVMVELSANQLPLAGGLNSFEARLYNRGYTPIYIATTRGGGSDPGDLSIVVRNAQGQEVSRTAFTGAVPGAIFAGGVGYALIQPGASVRVTVPNVLVPEGLAGTLVTFEAVASAIYDRASAGQQVSGPLSGLMQSSLAVTPYYGTAQTDRPLYSDETPVLITGQAIDRASGQPKPNAALKISFATRGYRWSRDVTTDANGNYAYTFNPAPGMAGTLTIWAAHPDVFDQLNQAQITIYRLYATPALGDIRMSKNDTLDFNITLINPGDVTLTGFSLAFEGYRMQGTNKITITNLQGLALYAPDFLLGPNERRPVTLRLRADADAPDNAVAVFTLQSSQGASVKFTGNVTLSAPVPIISVVKPDIGYVEVSVDRGSLLSREVVIMNRGLKDLKGVTFQPPTNVAWMIVNLPTNQAGTISFPDLNVGQSNSFTVVFMPPTNAALQYHQDKIVLRGTNAVGTFDVNLYAKVTSSKAGDVQFYVDNILGLPVPNATVRLRSTALQVELPAVTTDINGLVTVSNLQEGNWSWQISAPGHSANVGVVNVIPGQIVQVAPPETRLSKSLVTVNFSVVPVPYTDRYEIKIEQTFETHVPAPVLVLDPTYMNFDQVQPGFEANFIVTAKNHGLIAIRDVTINGSDAGGGRLSPLIDYLPELGPEETVEIPFHLTYGAAGSGQQSVAGRQGGNVDKICDPANGISGGFLDCLTGNLIQTACGLIGLNAIAAGSYSCYADASLIGIAQGLLIALTFYNAVLSPFNAVVSAFGCLVNYIAGLFTGPSDDGSPGAPGGAWGNFIPDGAGCFAAETRVLMADGRFKTIDQVAPGDVVRTGAGRLNVASVSEAHTRVSDKGREVFFQEPGRQESGSVRTTDEHFFWVDGKGWTKAADLARGDWLFNEQSRRVQITANDRLRDPLRVHTLKLKEDVAFYANGILVHDLCGTWSPNGPVFVDWTPPKRVPPDPAPQPVHVKIQR